MCFLACKFSRKTAIKFQKCFCLHCFRNSSLTNTYIFLLTRFLPWIADAPRYECSKFKVVCFQMALILTMCLLPMKQGFYKAMCTFIIMGEMCIKCQLDYAYNMKQSVTPYIVVVPAPNDQQRSCESISLLPW